MTVYTGGTFDLFHAGHVNLLRQCWNIAGQLGDEPRVVVALNTDEFIKQFKNSKPIMSYAEREVVLSSCKYVSEVIPNLSGADSKPTIMSANPDYIVIGDDWLQKDYYKQMSFTEEWLTDNGISLRYVPYTQNISTTNIKGRLKCLV